MEKYSKSTKGGAIHTPAMEPRRLHSDPLDSRGRPCRYIRPTPVPVPATEGNLNPGFRIKDLHTQKYWRHTDRMWVDKKDSTLFARMQTAKQIYDKVTAGQVNRHTIIPA